jgi:hypothetical protein
MSDSKLTWLPLKGSHASFYSKRNWFEEANVDELTNDEWIS